LLEKRNIIYTDKKLFDGKFLIEDDKWEI